MFVDVIALQSTLLPWTGCIITLLGRTSDSARSLTFFFRLSVVLGFREITGENCFLFHGTCLSLQVWFLTRIANKVIRMPG